MTAVKLRKKLLKEESDSPFLQILDERISVLAKDLMTRFAQTDSHFPVCSAIRNGEDL